MIVLSAALASSLLSTVAADYPVIGWENLATSAGLTATEEASGYPVTNLANPSTASVWLGTTTGTQYLTAAIAGGGDVDFVGVARHNFGTAVAAVSIEGDTGGGFAEIVAAVTPTDDTPLIFRFVPGAYVSVRVKIASATAIPTAAVLYVGSALVVPRRVYVGHTPINYGRSTNVVVGRSESGNFLGRVVVGSRRETSVTFSDLSPSWYRASFEPFVAASVEDPFFFAWRPNEYPDEVGFVWLTSDVQPTNQRRNGMMQVSLQMGGVA